MPGFEIFGEAEKRQVNEVLDSGVLFRYEFVDQRNGVYKVKSFEEQFAAYTACGYAQAVTSGTAALKVALKALGVGPGDEVITQGFTFVATWEAILEVGAIPVFCEIDATLNMDPVDLKNKLSDKTACIIPVHMMGSAARIEAIVTIGKQAGVPVLEDTAQSAGGHIRGKYLGTFGDCGTFSFDSVKTMTTGEGGMIITENEALWRGMSEYQDHGHDHAVNPGGRGGEGRSFIGFNYRMMEIQGAIGIAQLAKLDSMIAAQKKNKDRLKDAVSQIPGVVFREQVDPAGDTATFLSFTLPDNELRQTINKVLREHGAGAICWAENSWHFYPRWEHLLGSETQTRSGWPFMEPGGRRRIIYDPLALPASVSLLERTLSFPISINMPEKRFQEMEAAIRKAAQI